MPGGGSSGGGSTGTLQYLTINYVSEIGIAPTAKRISSTTTTFILTSTVLPEMSVNGYAFYGWSYNGAILSVGDTITDATEITVTAVWGRAKKFLDANGLTYFASKLNDYPTNELLGTVIDAIDEAKQDKAYDIIYNISSNGTVICNKTFNEILTLINQKAMNGQQVTLVIAINSSYIIPTALYPHIDNNEISYLTIVGTIGLTTMTIDHYPDHINRTITEEIIPSNFSDLNDDIGYAPIESPDLAGTPTAPTAAAGTATTQLATTAFVQTAVSNASSGLLKRLIVSTLPTSNIDNNTIYMIAKSTSGINDAYNEFMYINNSWELVGSTETDLSDYYTQNEVNTLLDEKQSINLDIYYHYDEINDIWLCNKTFTQIYTLLRNTLNNKKNINIAMILSDDTPSPKVYFCTKATYNSSTSSFEFTFNDRLITHSNTDDIDLTETIDITVNQNSENLITSGAVYTAIHYATDDVYNEIADLNGVKDNNGFLYNIINQWISAHLNDAINTEYYQDMYSSLNASAKTMAKVMFDNNAPTALIGRNPTLTTLSNDNGITLSLVSSNITDTNDGQQWYQMTDIRTINSSLYRVEFNMILVVENDELVHAYLVMSAYTLGFSVDTAITQNSNNLITSGAVYTSIGNVETLLEDLL